MYPLLLAVVRLVDANAFRDSMGDGDNGDDVNGRNVITNSLELSAKYSHPISSVNELVENRVPSARMDHFVQVLSSSTQRGMAGIDYEAPFDG